MGSMFPTMFDETTRMSIDFTTTLASEDRSFLLAAHYGCVWWREFFESADGDGSVVCLMTVREIGHSCRPAVISNSSSYRRRSADTADSHAPAVSLYRNMMMMVKTSEWTGSG